MFLKVGKYCNLENMVLQQYKSSTPTVYLAMLKLFFFAAHIRNANELQKGRKFASTTKLLVHEFHVIMNRWPLSKVADGFRALRSLHLPK
jgi:hypothetical protein